MPAHAHGMGSWSFMTDKAPELGFDANVPHIARIYDYWLGGKDNFAADREAGDLALES
jgi:S-adenosyl methyltransferase